jgi:hypothetical protein
VATPGDNLAYQVTVDDPNVLAEPWTEPARPIKPSNEPLEKSTKNAHDGEGVHRGYDLFADDG